MSIRTRRDADKTVSKALPAAAANNNSVGIDLGSVTPGVLGEIIEVILEVPALPALADAKTVIFTLQDSADNSSFTAIPELATMTVTGGGGIGAAAASRTVRLPSSVRRYIGYNQAVLSAGGDSTAVSSKLSLLF